MTGSHQSKRSTTAKPDPKKSGAAQKAARSKAQAAVPVGGCVLADAPIELNAGRPRVKLKVRNTGDRPIQVGSHFHFFEVNRALSFDRSAAFGMRLDIPANAAIRFEPGDEKDVTVVPYGGKRFAYGFNNLVDGWTGEGPKPGYRPNYETAVRRARELGFKSKS